MMTALFMILGLAILFGVGGMYIIYKLHTAGMFDKTMAGVEKLKKVAEKRRKAVSDRESATTFSAIIYKADEPNGRGIMYPREELVEAVKRFKTKTRYGYMGTEYQLSTSKISHMINLNMQGDLVVASIKPTDNERGRMLISKLQKGVDFSAYPIMVGSVCDDNTATIDKIFSVNVIDSGSVDFGKTKDRYKLKAVEAHLK